MTPLLHLPLVHLNNVTLKHPNRFCVFDYVKRRVFAFFWFVGAEERHSSRYGIGTCWLETVRDMGARPTLPSERGR